MFSPCQDLLYIPCGVLVAGVMVMADSALPQTLVVDPHHGYYSVYMGKKLVATHHCHNIYVRVMTRPGRHTHTHTHTNNPSHIHTPSA